MIVSRSKSFIVIGLLSISFFSALLIPANAWQNVFCNIALFESTEKILCEGLRDTITFKEGSGITIDLDPTNQIVTWSASSSGDGNTAQIADAGSGLGWFSSRYNATMNYLKSLSCGTNLTCTSNSTVISISASGTGESNTMSNIGTGTGEIYKQKTGVNFEVRTLLAGTGITIVTNPNDITISSSGGFNSANNVGSGELGLIANNSTKIDIKRLDCDATLNCFNGTSSNTIGVASISEAQVTNLVSDLTAKQSKSEKNQNLGYAGLGSTGRLQIAQQNGTTEYNTNKGISNGYASLNSDSLVPSVQLGSGSNSSSTFLRGDRTWSSVSGVPVSLSGNLTTTSTAAFTTIFTIPMTANSGNVVNGVLVAESNTAGGAVQAAAHLSTLSQTGWCLWYTPISATTQNIDFLVLNTAAAETAETTWLPAVNTPQPILFTCTVKGGGTPNLIIEFQAEVASTVKIDQGSYYIKSP